MPGNSWHEPVSDAGGEVHLIDASKVWAAHASRSEELLELMLDVFFFLQMSAITVGCTEAFKTSVDITCDSVDSSIKVCPWMNVSLCSLHVCALVYVLGGGGGGTCVCGRWGYVCVTERER